MWSLPVPPITASLPASPLTVSAPLPPSTLSPPWSPSRVSSPPWPCIRSPQVRDSWVPRPLMVLSMLVPLRVSGYWVPEQLVLHVLVTPWPPWSPNVWASATPATTDMASAIAVISSMVLLTANLPFLGGVGCAPLHPAPLSDKDEQIAYGRGAARRNPQPLDCP